MGTSTSHRFDVAQPRLSLQGKPSTPARPCPDPGVAVEKTNDGVVHCVVGGDGAHVTHTRPQFIGCMRGSPWASKRATPRGAGGDSLPVIGSTGRSSCPKSFSVANLPGRAWPVPTTLPMDPRPARRGEHGFEQGPHVVQTDDTVAGPGQASAWRTNGVGAAIGTSSAPAAGRAIAAERATAAKGGRDGDRCVRRDTALA